MSDKILIVEHDSHTAELITAYMQDLGLQVTHCNNGDDGLKQALAHHFSLLIVDLNLPSCSGLYLCRKVKEANQQQVILMITPKSSETDRALCLKLGVDDYINAPFNVRDLQARVNTLLNRVHLLEEIKSQSLTAKTESICHGKLMINKFTNEVILRDQRLALTSTEFNLLSFMAERPNQVFSRAHLLDKVWGEQSSGYGQTVNSHINRLRNKLVAGQPDSINKVFPDIIQTVFGVGYKFNLAGVA